ncbi:MAG: Holliday junction resolvase RuvX [Proteobacteria bacterium]|jgi:putative holliday junction resolvase|nr:Holliday junction resolvase RuvX [Pseudomonadota bacterium]
MTELAMAFDYGTKRIGVAVGQKITGTATPVAVVKARDGVPDWQVIGRLVEEWKPTVFVVGLPINMDGTESDMSVAATRFSRRLNGRYGIRIELMDERLSTFEAREFETTDQLDAIAAKLILETWLADST